MKFVNFPNSLVRVIGLPRQPSLMFAVKSGTYPCEAPFRCSTLGQAAGLIHGYYNSAC
jgi:hypothetical protein